MRKNQVFSQALTYPSARPYTSRMRKLILAVLALAGVVALALLVVLMLLPGQKDLPPSRIVRDTRGGPGANTGSSSWMP